MALADKTRLRLLNLMRGQEICVCFFTEILEESQPKVSRHLAYLRTSGLVEARRDGKWMHYRIAEHASNDVNRILEEVLERLALHPEMQAERARYNEMCCSPEMLVQIARTPIDFLTEDTSDVGHRVGIVEPAHNELEEFLL